MSHYHASDEILPPRALQVVVWISTPVSCDGGWKLLELHTWQEVKSAAAYLLSFDTWNMMKRFSLKWAHSWALYAALKGEKKTKIITLKQTKQT